MKAISVPNASPDFRVRVVVLAAICAFLALSGPITAFSQPLPVTGPAVPELAGVDQVVTAWMNQYQFKAATLAIIRNKRLVYTRGFGWQDRNLTQAIHPNAVMRLASIGKPITAAAIQKLVADGQLSLNAKVFDILQIPPSGPVGDPYNKEFTLDQLLKHTSGVWPSPPSSRDVAIALGLNRAPTADEVVSYMWTRPLGSTPGVFNYANWGYELLCVIIEKASGMPWGEYIRTQIAAPAHATTIAAGGSNGDAPREIWYHGDALVRQDKDYNNTLPLVLTPYAWHTEARGGCVISSAPDLCLHFNRYFADGNIRGDTTGWSWAWYSYGSNPGVWAAHVERISPTNGQYAFALIFNRRLESDGAPFGAIVDSVIAQLEAVQTWPTQEFAAPITGNNLPIYSGDTTPISADQTDFGTVNITNGTASRTFKITHTDVAPLQLTGTPLVAITGAHAADFTVTTQPAATVAAGGGSTTFTITFDPSAVGLRTATVSIATDILADSPYTFAIQGNGAVVPLTLAASSRVIPAAGGSFDLGVSDSDIWTWSLTGGDGWLTSNESASQAGEQTFSYTLAPNTTSASRTATFTFTSGTLVRTHTVTQHPHLSTRTSGPLVAWGLNDNGQAAKPAGLGPVIAAAGGNLHSLAIKEDGTVAAWGYNAFGQTNVPIGLTGVMAVAAGSHHTVALREDGTVVTWGQNTYGQCTVPDGLTGVIAVAAGQFHTVALKAEGTVTAWGRSTEGQTTIPTSLANVIAIAAGSDHAVALRSSGTVAAWGANGSGQTNVPGGLTNVIAIAAGQAHSVALKSDGTVTTWGSNSSGQTTPPVGLTNIVAIAAGQSHTLALKSDGTVVSWGANNYGQRAVPAELHTVTAISAGSGHSLVIGYIPPVLTLTPSLRAIPETGASQSFGVTSNIDWTWTQTGGDGWLTTTEETAQNGNQTFSYAVAVNAIAAPRTATITLSGGGLTQTHTINQAPALYPKLILTGNAVPIVAEDTIPATDDHTDFGPVGITGATLTRTFTLGNIGAAPLTFTGSPRVLISGEHAADFTVTAQPPASIAIGTSATFAITFDPSAAGLRTALVSLASNDPDTPLHTFAIQGDCQTAGVVTFAAAATTVSQGASVVTFTLTLNRTGSTQPFAVNVACVDGIASLVPPFAAAKSDTDYVLLSGAAATPTFDQDQTTRTVRITLLPLTAASTPNKRFTVKLTNADSGVSLGSITTVTVQILATDTGTPTLTVTTPAANAKLSTVAPYLVTGTAGDAKGIDYITVKLNSDAPVPAILAPKSFTSVPFSLPITPNEGDNTLIVTAYDIRGNFKQVIRPFKYTRRHLLTLTRNDPSRGSLALAATPSATALIPTTALANPKTSQVLPAATVKLTATALPNYVFKQWSGQPGDATLLGSEVSFPMTVGDLTVSAEFIPTPFIAPIGLTNNYLGLLRPLGGIPAIASTGGLLTGTLTNTGAFTGTLLIDGVSQPFVATFIGDGSSVFTVAGKKTAPFIFGDRSLTLSFASGVITATLTKGAHVSQATAARAVYSATNKILPGSPLLNPASTKGSYTLIFPFQAQTPPIDTATYPQGHGYATLSLTNLGIVTLSGLLADGTPITASSALQSGGLAPIFIQLPTPGAAATVKGGALIGQLTFDSTQLHSDFTGGQEGFLWHRPAAVGTKILHYTSGWPNGISSSPIGAQYLATTTVQATLGLGAPSPTLGNARLTLSGGKLSPGILKTNFNITASTFKIIAPGDLSYTMALTPATGLISGTFQPNWASPVPAKPAFKGILLQKGLNKGGWGFFQSNAKNDLTPQTGAVSLSAPLSPP